MTTTEDSLVASMLLAVSMSSEESSRCALAEFAQDLRLRLGEDKGASMTDVLADRCLDLVKEEERITAVKDSVLITYDKLCAEVNRIEAQLKEQERQLQQVAQQKKMYRLAVNLLVAGAAPRLVEVADVGSPSAMSEGVPRQSNIGGPRDDFLSEPLTSVAPPTGPKDQRQTELASAAAPPTSTKVAHTSAIAEDHAQSNGMNSSPMSLLTMLRIPDVKESALLQALKAYESDLVEKAYAWLSNSEHLDIFLAIAKHLPEPRPPIQLLELQILGLLFQVNLPPSSPHGKNVQPLLESLITKGNVVPILVKLLNSVNDDIKCEVLESLAPLVSMTHPSLGTNNGMGRSCRQQFLAAGGLDPLIGIVACSTSEAVLERALVLLWGILSKDDKDDAEHNGGRTVRAAVHELGGLRAVLDLLYTDSLAILENVSMVIGYITRDDEAKVEIREIGGLEKVTATLRHPSDSIQTKMAGIVWNCSSNADNRQYLRQLGAIPALLELLQSPEDVRADRGNDYVRENAAGALWNLSVDAENKTQIMEYGGVGSLLQTISRTTSEFVVENVTGTLWNCSAAPEARPLLRKAGGIPILLSFLQTEDASGKQRPARFSNEKALDNICGILRNCSISDQNKPVIREAGGVELILKRIVERLRSRTTEHSLPLSASAVDKLASTLWILTISPDIKHTVRHAKGIELITSLLWDSSPSIAARLKKRSDFASIFDGLGRPTSGDDALEMMMKQVPFATPSLFMNMSTKEKLAGVLRNCTTIQESRPLLLQTKAVQCLVSLIADCFYSETVFPTRVSNSKSGSQLGSPSLQLRETVASALWYLSRDDKVVPREQGGLQLLCLLVTTPRQPAVVMEQAAGALSSLTVNNAENRTAVRQWGGLLSLVRFVSDRAMTEYPQRSRNQPSSKAPQDNLNASNTFAIVNALLTIRNGTVSCDPNLQLCCSIALDLKSRFVEALVHVLRNAPEECAREAALTIKNLCGASRDVVRLFASREVPSHLKGLLERSSTETVRRAAVLTLEVFTKER